MLSLTRERGQKIVMYHDGDSEITYTIQVISIGFNEATLKINDTREVKIVCGEYFLLSRYISISIQRMETYHYRKDQVRILINAPRKMIVHREEIKALIDYENWVLEQGDPAAMRDDYNPCGI